MRVLPRVVIPALIAGAVLTGCSKFDAALGQRQALVSFKDGTSTAERLHVRATCAKPPRVSAAPLPSGSLAAYDVAQIAYQVNNASNADIARLEVCLSKFPSVAGVTLQDSSDQGS
ncbi:MAG: hypothetical protein JOY82_01245 [Streptosporangiaceae bacterium]|nr:hypothetical protein [Streptosporangiaceae bacterium]MBV9853137.1 hypothetical protein [Streptosporangiaceae bacterium]